MYAAAATAAKSLQSCLTLCDPIDGSPPGSLSLGFSRQDLWSVFWQFVVPLSCGGSSLWVGLGGWLVKVSWLGKLVSVFWWVELDFFSLQFNEVYSSEF